MTEQEFCQVVAQVLKGDHNDLRKEAFILRAHRQALATPSQPDPQYREPSDNQIDAAKAKAMDEAADFCIQTLAKALGVDDWEQADGSETWDGDVAGTIYNVLKAGRMYDDEDGRVARLEDAAQSRGQAFDGEGEAGVAHAITPFPSGGATSFDPS